MRTLLTVTATLASLILVWLMCNYAYYWIQKEAVIGLAEDIAYHAATTEE